MEATSVHNLPDISACLNRHFALYGPATPGIKMFGVPLENASGLIGMFICEASHYDAKE